MHAHVSDLLDRMVHVGRIKAIPAELSTSSDEDSEESSEDDFSESEEEPVV